MVSMITDICCPYHNPGSFITQRLTGDRLASWIVAVLFSKGELFDMDVTFIY